MIALCDFKSLRPRYTSSQSDILEWFIAAHKRADGTDIREKAMRVGASPRVIESRGHVLDDYLHTDWEKMKIFRLLENPNGEGLTKRLEVYREHANGAFEKFYEDIDTPPKELFHVSCTGYLAPSAAQTLVSKKRWRVPVVHAYHMGCYGAISAVRQASKLDEVDIVHTEICSIHMNPSAHSLDQIVAQSLFADGFIKYRATTNPSGPHLAFLNAHEEIVPNTLSAMTWDPGNYGFILSLSKEIPVHIARSIEGYLERLGASGECESALFAIHPGGPKILDHIQKVLSLRDDQITYSRSVLRKYGNMSSATIPHVWDEILRDPSIASGTKIVSLAFGPGLTITGTLMEKRC